MKTLLTQVRLFVLLARPAVVIAMAMFALVGAAQAGQPESLAVVPALLAVLGFLVASVAWNDLADTAVDQVNLPGEARRPLASGRVDTLQMVAVAIVGTAIALGAAATIDGTAIAITATGLVLSAGYSLPPLHLSRRGILAPLVLPFGFVAVPYLDAVLATTHRITAPDLALLAGLYLGFVGRIILKDFRDVKGDALFGKRTFLVRHGRVRTCVTSGIFWIAGSGAVLAVRDVTPQLVFTYAVQVGMAVWLLTLLARCTARRREDAIITAMVLVGRMQLVVVVAHVALLLRGVPEALYTATMAGLLLYTAALVASRLTGSNLTTTDLDVGVLDPSPTESRGTSTFISG